LGFHSPARPFQRAGKTPIPPMFNLQNATRYEDLLGTNVHSIDALMTRRFALKGHYPA
jgi:hypothetical protein